MESIQNNDFDNDNIIKTMNNSMTIQNLPYTFENLFKKIKTFPRLEKLAKQLGELGQFRDLHKSQDNLFQSDSYLFVVSETNQEFDFWFSVNYNTAQWKNQLVAGEIPYITTSAKGLHLSYDEARKLNSEKFLMVDLLGVKELTFVLTKQELKSLCEKLL